MQNLQICQASVRNVYLDFGHEICGHLPVAERREWLVTNGMDVCTRHLLTSHGLHSLAQDDPAYIGHYGGDQRQRDAAYHQGTVWSWPIGPFVAAYLRVYGGREQARSFLQPFIHHLADYGLGSISEVFDGDALFAARGCIAPGVECKGGIASVERGGRWVMVHLSLSQKMCYSRVPALPSAIVVVAASGDIPHRATPGKLASNLGDTGASEENSTRPGKDLCIIRISLLLGRLV